MKIILKIKKADFVIIPSIYILLLRTVILQESVIGRFTIFGTQLRSYDFAYDNIKISITFSFEKNYIPFTSGVH